MNLVTGSVVGGKYRVDRVVGEGGMGVVCLGTHLALGQRVAIKVLAAHVLGNEVAVARFEREARMSASLAHEHIVRVFDFGRTDEGAPFLVMEFLEGEDLATRIERDGPIAVDEALALLAQACEGLAEAHAHGLVHRDLKPSNLFLARRATGATVLKVIDFGIAKDGAAAPAHAMTRTNDVMGSPQYMSPEQVRDAKNLDARTDVWSLGATFYEALAGVPVFEAESLTDLLVQIATAPVPSLRARRAEVPADVEAVLLRCLARERDARYATMADLLADVRALLAAPRRVSVGSTSLAAAATVNAADGEAPSPFAQVRGKTSRPTRIAVGVGVGVVALAALAFVGARARTQDERAGYTEPARTTAPSPRELPTLEAAPATASEVARLAFAEGIQAYRDAARFRFVGAMQRAVEADPSLALAHLLVALESNSYDGAGAREHVRLARTHRGALSSAANALLEAAEAYVQPTWDLASFERRLVAAQAAYPSDSLIVEWLGMARQLQGFAGEAVDAYAAGEKLDPRRSTLTWRRGQALLLAGREADALEAWSRCLESNPHAIGCRDNRARLVLAPAGRCAEAETDLRALIAEDPAVPRYGQALANVLAAQQSSAGVVVDALTRRLASVPVEGRRAVQLDDQVSLALLDGDLASSIRFARELVALERTAIDERVASVHRLATLLDEAGDRAGAAQIVERFIARKDALPGARTSLDSSARLFVFLRDAGRMSDDAFVASWAAEAPRWDTPSTMRARPDGERPQSMEVWLAAYATGARARAEAERALALVPKFVALHPQVAPADFYARGRLFRLAERPADARRELERASRHCEALGSVERLRARLMVADLDAAEGKTAAACEGYADVVRALGHASPRSVSAEAARAAAAKLHCRGNR